MHNVIFPRATQGLQEGTVRRWLKKTGQAVAKGELLLEIETSEGLIQAEASVDGIVESILVPAGKTVKVQSALAVIAEGGDAVRNQKAGEGPVLVQPPPSSVSAGGVIPVLMPQAGQSMEEGTITKWRVRVGEAIAKGQIIFDVETDKATVEVEATDAGRLARIVVNEGQTMAVKKPVAFLADNEAAVDAYLKAQGAAAAPAVAAETTSDSVAVSTTRTASARVVEGGRVKASPAARRAAQARNIDLAAIGQGSGPDGRILSSDLLSVQPGAVTGAQSQPRAVAATLSGTRRKLSKMRRAIANNLLISKQTIPHFYARTTIQADALFAFYREQKARTSCSVNDCITLAVARTIKEFPAFRSQLDKDELVESQCVNIGIAVGIEDGLVVPVLLDVEQMSLSAVASNSRRMIDNARAGKLEGSGKGNFTITNLGMFGVEEFSAIINPPEPAILAVGALRESVIVKDGAMRAGRVMTMTLSCDHRVIDGVLAAKFLARLKEILEAPAGLGS